jgi:hypothetical protein
MFCLAMITGPFIFLQWLVELFNAPGYRRQKKQLEESFHENGQLRSRQNFIDGKEALDHQRREKPGTTRPQKQHSLDTTIQQEDSHSYQMPQKQMQFSLVLPVDKDRN